jgi:apolipoprotein N-acyltransferase
VKLVDKDLPRVFMLLLVFAAVQIGIYWGVISILHAAGAPAIAFIVFLGLTILFGAFDAVLSSTAYANLRVDRDGIIAADLANVFD